MKRTFTFLLIPLLLFATLVIAMNSALCAFGCKGGPTFDDWEEDET